MNRRRMLLTCLAGLIPAPALAAVVKPAPRYNYWVVVRRQFDLFPNGDGYVRARETLVVESRPAVCQEDIFGPVPRGFRVSAHSYTISPDGLRMVAAREYVQVGYALPPAG